ncbi:hypothetical protein [Leptotrichia hofstadii]|nr:hypothetical protein [Leptotrichia hofstadii]
MIKENVLDYIKEKYDINSEYLFSQFPSYFVFRNKKNWISIELSENIDKNEIIKLIDISYELIKGK